ncbi:MAG: DNA polymerase III subunit delta [Clostridia bacterium]|nr:DNA polymerase III subunit delta [Clostridia bacterium]
MKFEELYNNLNNLKPCYIINGGESFLTTTALKLIEQGLKISLPDFNKVIFSDESYKTATDIVSACQVAPFGDEKRLVVVYDYLNKKNEAERKVFLKYFENPCPTTCLVFFSTNKSEFFTSLEGKAESIECDKISIEFLKKWVRNQIQKKDIKITDSALNKLLDYCNYSITKLDTELNKLNSIYSSQQQITEEDIENNVTKDIEYIIFDLTNAICQKNNDKVYSLIDVMLKNKEQPVNIIATISNHFRRLFLISRSEFSSAEMAKMLNVKEYAITKYLQQAQNFGQRALKSIYDKCIEVEFLAKNGGMEAHNAVNFLIANILNQ